MSDRTCTDCGGLMLSGFICPNYAVEKATLRDLCRRLVEALESISEDVDHIETHLEHSPDVNLRLSLINQTIREARGLNDRII